MKSLAAEILTLSDAEQSWGNQQINDPVNCSYGNAFQRCKNNADNLYVAKSTELSNFTLRFHDNCFSLSLSVCRPVCRPVYLSICLPVFSSFHPSIHPASLPSIHPAILPSIHPSTNPPTYQSLYRPLSISNLIATHAFIHYSIFLPVCLCIYLFVC